MKGLAHPVVLFDGECNVCNASVQFLIPRDSDARLRFASLQSPAGQRLLGGHGLSNVGMKSVVLIEGGQVYLRSTAALRIARHLNGAWQLLAWLVAVPAPLRDWVYDRFAENRYRLFGRTESCLMLTPGTQARFLEK